ncbi:Rho gtpase-activating protein [Thalictrum thalictroides]|uniref:Rho gtpase-activating protein n=1 Tax=Thalictrum thalictroides TaxID=46969 RepID=A0A7J6X5W2_THATH|nr:Rho gtpase-activating protein [Thalictrum thalictroides]
MVFKSGPLFISSRGIGWKSWKKRWFILTRTSLVFFKNDPSALPQKGGEVNLTLGGIDLNNSGSVVVREDKKLLTVLFPDGREGRGFTLKAETSEDLFEWKTALEHALSQAPSAALVMGQNGIFRSDTADTIETSLYQWRDKSSTKSLVVGRPILLALEDIDGGPSFLEKALRFLEKFGTKAEGILRLSADVEEVYLRVQEYERGKNEFSSLEDAHVIGDCVKHILREMPSSPVPASCCTALLEAYRVEQKEDRINALRSAILDTFPEPNRRLLQRILKMMHTIAGHASENRMTASAVAACMAPLLLRPLLAGECELDDNFDMNGDNSAQLLAAANAANNAQAIVTTLLEEYESIFNVDNLHRRSLSADSRIEISGSEDSLDDETLATKDNGFHDAENEVAAELHDDPERIFSGKLSESSGYAGSDLYDNKAQGYGGDDSDAESSGENYIMERNQQSCKDPHKSSRNCSTQFNEQSLVKKGSENLVTEMYAPRKSPGISSQRSMAEILSMVDPGHTLTGPGAELCEETPSSKISVSNAGVKRSTFWGRNTARKNTSVESIDSSGEEELAIQRLEITKIDLHNRIAKEEKGNAILQASLERRKQALHERRMALEQDVSRLQEQLQAERDLRAALEVGLSMSTEQFSSARGMDSKTREELEEIALAEADVARLKQKVAALHLQLNQQRHTQYGSLSDACDRYQRIQNLHTQQKFHQQDFDTKLAFVNHERKQKSEESSSGAEWGTVKTEALTSAHKGAQLPGKPVAEATSLSNSVSTGTSTNILVDELCAVDSASVPSTSKITEAMAYQRHPSTTSSALVELTTRLDFFKERRNQLMEQLYSLDLNNELGSSHGFAYKPSSPPWN